MPRLARSAGARTSTSGQRGAISRPSARSWLCFARAREYASGWGREPRQAVRTARTRGRLIVAEILLHASALSADAFKPFGEVIEIEGRSSRWINDDTCRRFDGLAYIDVAERGGRPVLSVFEATPRSLPVQIRALERHPLSSQAFYPLEVRPFLVVVAEAGPTASAGHVQAFVSSGRQGVNYRRNTWHHP